MVAKSVLIALVAVLGSARCIAREWTDTVTNQRIDGDVADCKVTIKLANGHKRVIDLKSLSEDDQQAVLDEIRAAQAAKAEQPKAGIKPQGGVAAGNKAGVGPIVRPDAVHTTFGSINAPQKDIDKFLERAKSDKPKLLESIKTHLSLKASSMTPVEIKKCKTMFQFLEQDKVVIADRTANWDVGKFFKSTDDPLEPRFSDTGKITAVKIFNKDSALVKIANIGDRLILEGIDTSKIPKNGEWESKLLLRAAGTKKLPGEFGDIETAVIQAVSDEGFPKDIIIW